MIDGKVESINMILDIFKERIDLAMVELSLGYTQTAKVHLRKLQFFIEDYQKLEAEECDGQKTT